MSARSKEIKQTVIYVAETACCGPIVHDPSDGSELIHVRKNRTHRNNQYWQKCHILRYYEFTAAKAISKKQMQRLSVK